jgi:putative ATP-dependent endonuclease of OLD family
LDSAVPVALEAIPTRVFDMVGKIQVHLKSSCGAKLSLHRHGEGTQSLAVLLLFQAFAAAAPAEAYAPESTPILALEEPETHLHSSAIRSLGSFLENMTGQILVTSHSGDLVSRVPVTALRRLYKHHGETKIGRVESGAFTHRELQAIDYCIRIAKGHYLFSRCWLLVGGESDFHLMPLLFELIGHSQDQISFSALEISQVIDKGEPLIKFAKALGIQWFMMADGDPAGNVYVNRADNHLATGESFADRARALTHADIEHKFWHNGYSDFMLNMVLPQTRNQIDAQAAGDDVKKTEGLINAAIKQAGGKPLSPRHWLLKSGSAA